MSYARFLEEIDNFNDEADSSFRNSGMFAIQYKLNDREVQKQRLLLFALGLAP